MRNHLVYFVVGCAPDYVKLLEFCVTTLCATTRMDDIDVLVLCDADYARYVRAALPWAHIHVTAPNPTPVLASTRKLEIFDYANLKDYWKVLYLDCDIVVRGDVSRVFDIDFLPDVLYVKTESRDVDLHREEYFSVAPYSDADMERFRECGRHVFNCGQFAFLNTPFNRRHFQNVRDAIAAHTGFVLYEQPFMNQYFNTCGKTDSQPLDALVGLLRCETSHIATLRDAWIGRGEPIVHFVNSTQHHLVKLSNMTLFFDHLHSREQPTAVYQSRDELHAGVALPGSPVVVEVGVFKGDFSRVLHATLKPRTLFLVDPFEGDDGDSRLRAARAKFAGAADVHLLKARSSDLRMFEDDTFDLAYLDFPGLQDDLELLYRKTKHGGWICGRGFFTNREKTDGSCDAPGVQHGVLEFCQHKGLRVNNLYMDGCGGFAIRVFKASRFRAPTSQKVSPCV